MYTIVDDTLIKIPKGDSANFAIQLTSDGSAYTLNSDEQIRIDILSVVSTEPEVSRGAGTEAQIGDIVTVTITSEDTLMLSGSYRYLLRLVNKSSGTVDTLLSGTLLIQ